MTENTEFGTLPRVTRDLKVLSTSGKTGSQPGILDGGILEPFTGVLDVQIDRGGEQRLDLSYLTLEGLLELNLPSPTGTTDRPTEGERGPVPTDDTTELRVRDLVYGSDDDESEGETDRQDVFDLIGQDERPTPSRELRRFDTTDAGDNRTLASDPDESSDRGAVDPTENQSDRSGDLRNSGQVSPLQEDRGPRRTVVDRSPSTDSDAGRRETGTVDSPRMSPEQTASAGGDQTGQGVTASRSNPDGSSAIGSSAASPTESAGEPRMVVEHRAGEERTAESEDRDRGDAGERGAEQPTPDFGQQTDREEPLAAVIESSRDPESELIDRLYRSLRKREAIERSRRGGR
mgnify:CR=1 FL=1